MRCVVDGVIGGAATDPDAATLARVARLGRMIAARGCTAMAASYPGLSRVVAAAARCAGGRVIDIPAHGPVPRPGAAPDAPGAALGGAPGAPNAEDEVIRSPHIVAIVGGRFGPPGDLAPAHADRRQSAS
jgi:hypothetical protein